MLTVKENKGSIVVKPEKCTGCRICQLECSFRYHKVFNPALANIRILETPDNGLSYVIEFTNDCKNCVSCVKSCVFGALAVEKGGE